MKTTQITESRRVLLEMMDRADRAADAHAGPPTDQTRESRRLLKQMNDKADRAADEQVARSTPMTPKK